MNRIDSSSQSQTRFNPAAGLTHDRAGSLAGEQVRISTAASILSEENREELGMHLADKIQGKTIKDRQVSGTRGVRRMQIEQIQAYLEATRRFPDPKALADLVRRMQTQAHPSDVAERASRSPAQQFALLQLALEDARTRGLGPDVLDRLQEALEDLDYEHGAAIQAGLNTAQVAADFAPDAEGVENFQQAYTDIVLGEKNFAQTLLTVLKRLPAARGDDFRNGLQALLLALGADLSAASPSRDVVRLQALVQDVYRLEVAGSVLDNCTRLSERVAQRHGLETVDALELMKELVSYTSERWVLPTRLTAMAERFQVAGLPERLAFHSGVRAIVRQMPELVFDSAEARLGVVETTQKVYDDTVRAEQDRQDQLQRDAGLTP
ncbi:MAG: TyeA family type III secretion system gatekeeper subunit [Ramlibacter sp.]